MNKWAVALIVGVVAAALLAGGCGGSDDGSGGGDGESISKAEFVKQAEAICKDVSQEALKAIGDATGKDGANPAELILASYSKEAEEIEALGTPAGDEAKVEAIVQNLEKAVEAGEDPDGLRRANELIAKVRTQAEALGLSSCPAG